MDKTITNRPLKLNIKNTLKISTAFFCILMLWQVYNIYCPIILESILKSYGITHVNYIIGAIMACDNIFAIIIMPIIGKWSDRTNTRFGKRMPFVIVGMLLTIIVFPMIALMFTIKWYVGVFIFMMLFLVIMQAYRSPAVALMPDVTPKPLRSKANAIINLIGYLGGVFVTILGFIPYFKIKNTTPLHEIEEKVMWPFFICTFILIFVLLYLVLFLKEKKLIAETKDDVEYGETKSDNFEEIKENNALSKKDFRNLKFILISVFLWFMSFNSFETFGSLFFKDLGNSAIYSQMATFLSISSIVSFLLFSGLSNKIGRKLTIIIGLILVLLGLIGVAITSLYISNHNLLIDTHKLFYILMSLIIGIGWALININSFPMVVEFANSSNIGRFTSYYYIASMLAQTITPIIVGLFMDFLGIGRNILFIYASVLMGTALVLFCFVAEKIKIKDRFNKKQ